MDRNKVVTGSIIGLLAVVFVGQLYLDKAARPMAQARQAPPAEPPKEAAQPAETKAVTVDEVIGTYLTGLSEASEAGKTVTFGGLLDELESPAYAQAALSHETAESLAKASIDAMGQIPNDSKDGPELKKRLIKLMTSRTRTQSAREYVLKVIEEGPQDLRQAALSKLGSPQGIGGKAVFAKVQELGEKGVIPAEALPAVLRRTGGGKAAEPIVALMKSTDNVKVISACVIALEDLRDPGLLGPALERLEQTGMIDKPGMIPWFGSKAFSKHLETAEGSGLTRAIKVIKARPSLIKGGLAAIERGLEKGDAETRRIAAEAVKKAVVGKFLDAKKGESLLAGRLDHETEPVLKAELTGGLEQVRGMFDKTQPEVKRQ